MSDVKLDREELFTRFDEINHTIGALRFENNFIAKTKELNPKMFQVRAQLQRTSNAKLDKMLSFQKVASDKTDLGYDFSSPNIASSNTTMFISPTNNVNFESNECKTNIANENVNKGKSIL